MRELKVEQDARHLVESRGCSLIKFTSPGRNGWPDRLLLVPAEHAVTPHAVVCFIEFKKPDEYPSRQQLDVLKTLRDDGFCAFWTDNVQRVETWLNAYVRTLGDR